jgi:hypothetical protein
MIVGAFTASNLTRIQAEDSVSHFPINAVKLSLTQSSIRSARFSEYNPVATSAAAHSQSDRQSFYTWVSFRAIRNMSAILIPALRQRKAPVTRQNVDSRCTGGSQEIDGQAFLNLNLCHPSSSRHDRQIIH